MQNINEIIEIVEHIEKESNTLGTEIETTADALDRNMQRLGIVAKGSMSGEAAVLQIEFAVKSLNDCRIAISELQDAVSNFVADASK